MIEVGFSIVLGFAIMSTLCGVIAEGSRGDRILMRVLVYIIVLSLLLSFAKGETVGLLGHTQTLVVQSFIAHFAWTAWGAALAIFAQLVVEGHVYDFWVKVHPQSAPTPEARFGKRARPTLNSQPACATLVGTSTNYLNSELDLRTDTLIRLCFCTFEDRGALTLSRLESSLRLGTGRRQKSFHKIAAGARRRPSLNRTIHRYWRSVNGSTRMSQSLFAELCCLARETQNWDMATKDRLKSAGRALGVPAGDITKLYQRVALSVLARA